MEFTVENLCGLLIRSKLLNPDDVKTMYQRWLAEAKGAAGDSARFGRWLVTNRYVTDYQASLIVKGQADHFFINQYKVLDRLGRGRTAGVYKAIHHLGQVVAIKVLPPSKSRNPQHLGRFRREAQLAQLLKHPNVVRTFQVGEAQDLHYLVMEYLEGETLDDVLQRRKRLPPHEACRIVYQGLQGLQHIHERGLVHRDLKPANLMLVPARAPGEPDDTLRATVKILDIGLGRALAADSAQDAANQVQLTGEGMLLGTPDYLAPEQARDPRTIDIRSDIYSLGCVLYHTLTGQPPFPDTNLLSQMVRHATETPRPLRELNPAVPDGLQQIINWMLAKAPAQRYPTPERAAQALQVFLAANSEPARPSEEGPQLRRYLTWLETAGNGEAKEAAAQRGKSPRANALPVPAARRHHSSKKQHKRRKRSGSSHNMHLPPPPPGAAPAARPTEFDVELVPTPPPAPVALGERQGIRLTKREWALIGIGAGAVTIAVLVGMTLAMVLR
jgi:serine/threonine protein kinase